MEEFDIVPELLEKIMNDFEEKVNLIKAEETFEALLKSNNLEDAYQFARDIGGALSESFSKFITADTLPNGRMYFNIANRIIPPSLKKAYNESEEMTETILSNIFAESKIGIKVQQGKITEDRITGIVNRASEAENFNDVKFLTGKPVIQNVTQSAVDDTIKANAQFHYKSGLRATVERRLGGNCCAWCKALAKKYDYPDVPDDVYRRHENCRCTVTYYPSKIGRGQDVWSKQWTKSNKSPIIASTNKINKLPETKRLKDILIHKSVGAKAKNYKITDKVTGMVYEIAEGTKIQDVSVFAGSGVKKSLYEDTLIGLMNEYPGSSSNWQHCKGVADLIDLDSGEIRKAEIHWFQEKEAGKHKFKVKEWLDES